MSITRNTRMLTRYNAWANQVLFAALAELPEDAVMAPRTTVFGNMANTLQHAQVVDVIWKAHLEGVPHGMRSRVPQQDMLLTALTGAQTALDQWYIGYADQLTPAAHDELLSFEFVDGGHGQMTRGDMLLHVVNHKTYHRGVVADMICQCGVRPPVMDLPVFLRDIPSQL